MLSLSISASNVLSGRMAPPDNSKIRLTRQSKHYSDKAEPVRKREWCLCGFIPSTQQITSKCENSSFLSSVTSVQK